MQPFLVCSFCLITLCGNSQSNTENETRLILSSFSCNAIADARDSIAFLATSFNIMQRSADKALSAKIVVPQPVDPGGGYTHEKHKQNYKEMYEAAICYGVLKDPKYAAYVKDMLLVYTKMYPTLPTHPKAKENHPHGKLFWQGLNESVWLFYTIQAYDLVKSSFTAAERENIENNLLRKVVDFLSVESYETFNKVHNHGTWSVAAVGMTGFVLQDDAMVQKALYGSEGDSKTGFLKQLTDLFSPDGYYSEGAYYQRYAILPFIVFAEAVEINKPEIEIFEFRDQLLKKAVSTLLQLTTENGNFYPYNDAIKDKTYLSSELLFASNIAFEHYGDYGLLPVVKEQGKVTLTNAGLATAIALNQTKATNYSRIPLKIKDGSNGDEGGVSILRMPAGKPNQLNVFFKYSSQGMGHGHFDRLAIMLYDNNGTEVLQDYGAARFLNVEAKDGGRYLKENKSFARQSIAHNTLVIDEKSHFGASVSKSSESAPKLLFNDFSNPKIQISCALEDKAYKDVELQRTVAIIKVSDSTKPFVLDIFKTKASKKHQYDLNFQYLGHVMFTSFNSAKFSSISPLGKSDGYEHLYKLSKAKSNADVACFTFLQNKKFYSISTVSDSNTEFILTQMGANDPHFNLRNDAGYIIRKTAISTTFINIIEPHGNFNPQLETVQSPNSNLQNLKLVLDNEQYTAVQFNFKGEQAYCVIVAANSSANQKHKVQLNGNTYKWTGNYLLTEINNK